MFLPVSDVAHARLPLSSATDPLERLPLGVGGYNHALGIQGDSSASPELASTPSPGNGADPCVVASATWFSHSTERVWHAARCTTGLTREVSVCRYVPSERRWGPFVGSLVESCATCGACILQTGKSPCSARRTNAAFFLHRNMSTIARREQFVLDFQHEAQYRTLTPTHNIRS